MSSTVFYKFFHQKVQSTIHFDGTGINVFDLKHEIIAQNQLGDGLDFNLRLYHSEQPDLEYENDQDVIPRSLFVLAKRSPAQRGARFNNASRYVTGKPRINRKVINTANALATGGVAPQAPAPAIDENLSEEDRIKRMFENQSNAWAQTQDELSTHKMIYLKPGANTAPEDLPPPGYMCYRCGGKDHWIKNCPTITDPNFEGKKIKRTTGIPRSYLKTISKAQLERESENGLRRTDDGEVIDSMGNTYTITEDGEYVLAMADSKTWLAYQEKQQSAVIKAQREYEAALVEKMDKDARHELIDPLARKPLEAPIVYTPCCKTKESLKKLKNWNYHQADLELVLIENDFHCPNCGAEDIFIDSLIRNEELEKEVETFVAESGLEDPNDKKRKAEDDEVPDAKKHHPEPVMMPMGFMPGMMPFPGMFMPPAGPKG